MTIHLHKNDLPDGLTFNDLVAVDTETTGLNFQRDRLCLAQISGGDGVTHLVQFEAENYDAPNLKALLTNPEVTKIFHYARFDMAIFQKCLGVMTGPVYCTKIASKLVRTYTDRHGLRELCRELLGQDISKQQQSSDWAAADLSEAQQEYAANDVLFLHALKARLDEMLAREGRMDIAQSCFAFLPTRVQLDLAGWNEEDLFAHS